MWANPGADVGTTSLRRSNRMQVASAPQPPRRTACQARLKIPCDTGAPHCTGWGPNLRLRLRLRLRRPRSVPPGRDNAALPCLAGGGWSVAARSATAAPCGGGGGGGGALCTSQRHMLHAARHVRCCMSHSTCRMDGYCRSCDGEGLCTAQRGLCAAVGCPWHDVQLVAQNALTPAPTPTRKRSCVGAVSGRRAPKEYPKSTPPTQRRNNSPKSHTNVPQSRRRWWAPPREQRRAQGPAGLRTEGGLKSLCAGRAGACCGCSSSSSFDDESDSTACTSRFSARGPAGAAAPSRFDLSTCGSTRRRWADGDRRPLSRTARAKREWHGRLGTGRTSCRAAARVSLLAAADEACGSA